MEKATSRILAVAALLLALLAVVVFIDSSRRRRTASPLRPPSSIIRFSSIDSPSSPPTTAAASEIATTITTLPPPDALLLPNNIEVNWAALAATTPAAFQDGLFFNQRTNQLDPIPGFHAPLQPHEASVSEFFCHPDSELSRRRREGGKQQWVVDAFKKQDVLKSENSSNLLQLKPGREILGRFFPEQQLKSDDNDALLDTYAAFTFHTSWLFRSFLPWKPQPVSRDKLLLNSSSSLPYRAFHDPQHENLYMMENFCIAPYSGGISFESVSKKKQQQYVGRDDTRGARHEDLAFRDFFNMMPQKLSSAPPPKFYDSRPVIFMPLLNNHRRNWFHSVVRYLSLSAIVGMQPFGSSSSSSGGASESDSQAPLLIFVSDVSLEKHDVPKNAVWASLFRLLDLPVAVVTSSSTDLSSEYVRRMACRHTAGNHSVADWIASRTSSSSSVCDERVDKDAPSMTSLLLGETPRLCFQRGVTWQSCYGGYGVGGDDRRCAMTARPFDDVESYSFGDFAPLTANRRRMLKNFVIRVDSCLPPAQSAPESAASSPLPRLWLDIRTLERRIRLLPLFLQLIENELVGTFCSEIFVREPLRGSRTQYLQELRRSNLWVGVHGAAEVHIALMRPRSVTVEMNVFYQRGESIAVDADRGKAWFTAFSKATHSQHSVVQVYAKYRPSFFVAFREVVQMIKEAACRWLAERNLVRRTQQQNQRQQHQKHRRNLNDECAAIGIKSDTKIRVLREEEFAGDVCVKVLQMIIITSASSSSSSSSSFFDKNNCQRIAQQLQQISRQEEDFPGGRAAVVRAWSFQSRSALLWQPLVALFVGDDYVVEKVSSMQPQEQQQQQQRQYRLIGCLDSRVVVEGGEGADDRSSARLSSCLFVSPP